MDQGLPSPPIKMRPDGAAQLEWYRLIMRIIRNIKFRTVRNISDLFSRSVVVLSQPESVRVRQDVLVSEIYPPQSVFTFWVWERLTSGKSGS